MSKKPPAKHDPPEQSGGDLVHAAARAIVGLVPGGSAALEFFNIIIAPPLEKRRQKRMEAVAEAIRKLPRRLQQIQQQQQP